MSVQALRAEHQPIIEALSRLGGVVHNLRTRADAEDARARIDVISAVLHRHLEDEDVGLYPTLIGCGVAAMQTLGRSAREEMGGLLGAWQGYCHRWTVEAMLTDPRRFAAATARVFDALSLRIELENDTLYPAISANVA